jgi:hypothetical protein
MFVDYLNYPIYLIYEALGSWSALIVIAAALLALAAAQYYLRHFQFVPPILAIFNRLLRGLFLILWITILSLVAFGSLTGGLANYVFPSDASAPERTYFLGNAGVEKECHSGAGELADYVRFRADPPPIGAVLDVVMPAWDGAIKCDESNYRALFDKIEGRLRSIARDQSADLKTVTVDASILTFGFAQVSKQSEKPSEAQGNAVALLPPEVQDWVSRESTRVKDRAQARALFSTFLLLSVLGAFGALIFLIRDYITLDVEKKLSDYIFRPVLGIFLAVAVFVVDVLAHSVISTASILQIRPEPLYILALGAGLLSETAYYWVRRNIDSTFARREQQIRSEQESQGKPSTHSEVPSPAELPSKQT